MYEERPPIDGIQFDLICHFLLDGFYPLLKAGGVFHARNVRH